MIRISNPLRILLRLSCLVILAILCLLPATVFAAEKRLPHAVNGTMDLQGWSFQEHGTVTLNGEWAFYWNVLADPGTLVQDESLKLGKVFTDLPHVWSPKNPAAPKREGAATYQLTILLEQTEAGRVKSLYIRNAATAYRVWVNGELLGGNGTVSLNRAEMTPKNYAKVFNFIPKAGRNDVVIQVSNFVQRKGGLWSPIELGSVEAINRKQDVNTFSQMFNSSALFILGLYHLSSYLLRKKDKLSLLTGSACLLLAIRVLLLGDTLLVRYFPQLDWEWAVKVEYWSVYLAVPLFCSFIKHTFPKESNRIALRIIIIISVLLSTVVLLFPARVFTYTMQLFELYLILAVLYLVYVVIRATHRGRVGARLCLFAGTVIIVTVFHDVLYYNQFIIGYDMAPYGVLIFFFVQTLVVAQKFSKAYEDVELLSNELSEINLKLEEKIKERTQALEISNSYLVYANENLNQLENSRRELIANVTHELGTPMTSIQGYMKALLDGVVQPEKQYIQIIYDKIQLAERLVQDLFDLTKLEEGQTSFHLVDVIVDELFDEDFSMFRLDVENQGVTFEVVKPECPAEMLAIIRIDPIRMRQVMTNLISNALNYTAEGGKIAVVGTYLGDRLTISVHDSGIGIDPVVLPYIFDRFVKGTGPRRNSRGGTGLGLAIVRKIVLHHGGIMTVKSEPGKGSIFQFDLLVEFIPMVVD